MLPSSSRVKLNRVALKDVLGLKLVPRRRRIPQPFSGVTNHHEQQEDSRLVSKKRVSVKDTGVEEPAGRLRRENMTPKDVTNPASGQESSAGCQPPKKRGGSTSAGHVMEFEAEGRCARDVARSVGLAGSEGSLRRAVGASGRGPEVEQSSVSDARKETTRIDPYPQVTLCDVARNSGVSSHQCSYLIPDVLKTKVVRCFKQDMKAAGLQFRPGRNGQNKHRGDELVGKHGEICPRARSNESGCQTPSPKTKHLSERTDAGTSSSQATCHFLENWPSEASATCSVFFLKGEHTSEGECRTGMWAEGVEWDPGPECDSVKTIKHGNSMKDCAWLLTPDSKSIECNNPAKTTSDRERAGPGRSVYNSELAFRTRRPFGSVLGDGSVLKNLCGERMDAAQTALELLCQSSEVEPDEPESFSCQRVRAYAGKTRSSCARTYMPWPLSDRTEPGSHSNATLPAAATDCTTQQVSHQNEKKVDDATFSREGNVKFCGRTSSLAQKKLKCSPLFKEDTLASPHLDAANSSTPSQQPATVSVLSSPFYGPETDCSRSTASPSELGLVGWETGSSSMTSPWPNGEVCSLLTAATSFPTTTFVLNQTDPHSACASPTLSPSSPKCAVETLEHPLIYSEETQISSSSVPQCDSESSQSCESSLLLFQEEQGSDGEVPSGRSPPTLEPYYDSSPFTRYGKDRFMDNNSEEASEEPDLRMFLLPPLLSPFTSPHGHSQTSLSPQSPYSSAGKEEEARKHGTLPGCHAPQTGNRHSEKCMSDLDRLARGSTCCCSLADDAMREVESSPSSDADDEGRLPDTASSDGDKADSPTDMLDEVTAYEQDILLVEVTQDDPELFDNLPQQSLLKLGPVRVSEVPKTSKTHRVSVEQRLIPVHINFHCGSPDVAEKSSSRPWRPQCSSLQSSSCAGADKHTAMGQCDSNNNHVAGGLGRGQPIQTLNPPRNPTSVRSGSWIQNQANVTDFRHQKSNSYCRLYFSESQSCGFKTCWFQHVPVEGDEKFCVDTVSRFSQNPVCLQRAGAVFTGYYRSNPPGVYFSMRVLLTLLWALLKAGMVSDIVLVLSVCVSHKIVPSHEFLLALFNFVREKGFMGFVPELMKLTFKMASVGLVLSLDCFDCVKNTPEFQQMTNPTATVSVYGNHKLPASTSGPFSEYLNLAHAYVEIELCVKQEDWKRMGEVFRSICQSSQHPSQVERISGHIAVALLSESKDKRSLPFAAFTETICQHEGESSLVKSCLGRIGVSLMLRYHKTRQWAKGQRVVEVLSASKVNYSMLKGLFGNEDRASRCCLITMATELFLLTGCVEGALNTLRENKWFLSSCSWPCELADLESRSRVLMHLAEKTSHRDTLEVLCNLPGLKEPHDLVDTSRYSPLLNSHLQVCVDRQMLPVASDTVDFMFSKKLSVDNAALQMLLHKLGKQSLWLRAREVFRRSLGVGYYPEVSAPPGLMSLIVPCRLGEVELALAFELFITVNATAILQSSEAAASSLSITLKRTQSSESEYLSAGSRLLSAAGVPQPKLTVHYTTVNSTQEQVFTLEVASARRWLRSNHLWANEMWTH